jgi:hypothetical protein
MEYSNQFAKSKTTPKGSDPQINLHEMFAYNIYREHDHKSLTSYRGHSVHGRSEFIDLEQIVGAFEEHYADEFKRSLTSQLSHIAANTQLYNRQNSNIEGPGLIKYGKNLLEIVDRPALDIAERPAKHLLSEKSSKKTKSRATRSIKSAKEFLDSSNDCGCVGNGDCVCASGECECEGSCDFCGKNQ